MQKPSIPHNFIVVEGNIGVGKTTLSTMLSEQLNRRLILEEFSDNPFLPYFYENPERYAFPVELFFMTERHKQLQEELSQPQLFEQGIISDYIFLKTLLFARNNLKAEEFRLFQRLFHILSTNFPKPDLLLYLHQPIDRLLENIRKRGRAYEQQMNPDYLLQIQQAYFDYFKTVSDIPIVVLDVQSIDFVQYPEHYQAILKLLSQDFGPGMHQIQATDLLVVNGK
ncbi:MAG: deoxynucleoside kinase [Bacteroidota bacterium]